MAEEEPSFLNGCNEKIQEAAMAAPEHNFSAALTHFSSKPQAHGFAFPPKMPASKESSV